MPPYCCASADVDLPKQFAAPGVPANGTRGVTEANVGPTRTSSTSNAPVE
jgi:hypothetical protein